MKTVSIAIPDDILGMEITGVKAVFTVLVTPEGAKRVLEENNTHNRKLSLGVVSRYADDMREGNWRSETNEVIGIGKDGVLKDGQHRLTAVVQSGRNVQIPFMLGVDNHYGVGFKRMANHVLDMVYDEQLTVTEVAITRALVAPMGVNSMTEYQLLDLWLKHKDAVRFACGSIGSKERGTTTAATIAVYARAFYHEDHKRIAEFAKILNTGDPTGSEKYTAALRLRDQLIGRFPGQTLNVHGGVTKRIEIHRRTENALYNFCRHRDVSRLFPASSELYPLPEEK